jgi:PAS domain S-box-containing protein
MVKMTYTRHPLTAKTRPELAQLPLDTIAIEAAVIDAQTGRLLDVNRSACEWLGYSKDELLQMHISEIQADPGLYGNEKAWPAQVAAIRDHGGRLVLEGRHRRKDGSTFPVVRALSLFSHERREYVVASAIDVTVERRLARELADMESRAVAMILAIPDICLLLSKDLVFRAAFAHDEHMFISPPREFIGRSIDEFLPPDLVLEARRATDAALKTGELQIFEYDMPRDGEMGRWEARVIKRAEDEVLVLCRDITELRSAETRLLERARLVALGEMSASVAHEIKNPLSAVFLNVQKLASEIRADAPKEHLLAQVQRIDQVAHRIADIVSALGTLGRNEERDPFIEVSAHSIVADVYSLCHERFRTRSIAFSCSVSEEIRFECRPGQIAQILLNLLTNAVDAVERLDDRWCRLEVRNERESVIFAVIDSGRGIPQGLRQQIMEPFFTTKMRNKGTGLGLSISRRLASEHHGALLIDENSSHTTFLLKIPKRQPSSGHLEGAESRHIAE